mmetsp:Transcript_5052/g.15379  ORF Transcript_5052/g.15379 Transcript_5052/m.15379 type:complete len:760 (-) Transcript_5052:39-2318(-)
MSVASLRIELEASRVDGTRKGAQVDVLCERLQEETGEKNRLLNMLTNRLAEHGATLSAKTKEIAELAAMNERLKIDREKLTAELDLRKNAQDTRLADEVQARADASATRAEAAELRQTHAAEKARLMATIKQLNAVNESLRASTKENEDLQAACEDSALKANTRADQLQMDLEATEQRLEDINRKWTDQESHLKAQISNQEKRIYALEDMLQMSDGKIERMSTTIEMFKKQFPDDAPVIVLADTDSNVRNAESPTSEYAFSVISDATPHNSPAKRMAATRKGRARAMSASPTKDLSRRDSRSGLWSLERKLLQEREELKEAVATSRLELMNQKLTFGDTLYENATLKATVHDLENLVATYANTYGPIADENLPYRSRRVLVDTFFTADVWKKIFGKVAKAPEVVAFINSLISGRKKVTQVHYTPNPEEDDNESMIGVEDGPIELNEVEVIRSRFADFVTMRTPAKQEAVLTEPTSDAVTVTEQASSSDMAAKRQLDFSSACREVLGQMQDAKTTAAKAMATGMKKARESLETFAPAVSTKDKKKTGKSAKKRRTSDSAKKAKEMTTDRKAKVRDVATVNTVSAEARVNKRPGVTSNDRPLRSEDGVWSGAKATSEEVVVVQEVKYALDEDEHTPSKAAIAPAKKSKTIKKVPAWRRKVNEENARKKMQHQESRNAWLARKQSMRNVAPSKPTKKVKSIKKTPLQRDLNRAASEHPMTGLRQRTAYPEIEFMYEVDASVIDANPARGGMGGRAVHHTALV